MTDMRISGLVFDRGIDSITYAQQDAQPTLPERGESAPPDVGARAQLSALLDRPSIDDFLEYSTRPQIANRDLLVPARFRERLDNALQQLRDVAPILFPREVAPGLYELVYNSCLRAGIDMERAWQSSQISSSLSMVNAGFGFALVPQSMTCIQQPNVSYHPLSGAPLKTDIAIAWRRFERSRTVKRFLAMF